MPFRLTIEQIKMLISIEKIGTSFCVELKGGQTITGKNLFYIADQIKQRFHLQVTALQLQAVLDKDKQ
tara:strand:- start:44 stop:247 length:204 start_codon:yes stop_codon:yes gene_type:complete